ncbi:MAG: hypothetical protein JWQ38_2889 [Flavipsychrobacter sp.]|nr:hypothetical protein [Flavipsychrobacter sp.]
MKKHFQGFVKFFVVIGISIMIFSGCNNVSTADKSKSTPPVVVTTEQQPVAQDPVIDTPPPPQSIASTKNADLISTLNTLNATAYALDTVTIGGGDGCRAPGLCSKGLGVLPVVYVSTSDVVLIVAFNIKTLKSKQPEKVVLFTGSKVFTFADEWKISKRAKAVMKNKGINVVSPGTKCPILHKGDLYWFAIPLK